jgi:CheY-like chemotaxis protein
VVVGNGHPNAIVASNAENRSVVVNDLTLNGVVVVSVSDNAEALPNLKVLKPVTLGHVHSMRFSLFVVK